MFTAVTWQLLLKTGQNLSTKYTKILNLVGGLSSLITHLSTTQTMAHYLRITSSESGIKLCSMVSLESSRNSICRSNAFILTTEKHLVVVVGKFVLHTIRCSSLINNSNPSPGLSLHKWITDAGFENIVEEKYKLPIGPWAKDKHLVCSANHYSQTP